MAVCSKCKKGLTLLEGYSDENGNRFCEDCWNSKSGKKIDKKDLVKVNTKSMPPWFLIGQIIVSITFLYAMFFFSDADATTIYQQQLLVAQQIKWFLVAIFLELGQIAFLITNRK